MDFNADITELDDRQAEERRALANRIVKHYADAWSARFPKGYEHALGSYLLVLAERLADEGHSTPAFPKQVAEINDIMDACDNEDMPPWWGREDIYSSHRSALLYKAPEHYGQFGWTDPPLGPGPDGKLQYVWPV